MAGQCMAVVYGLLARFSRPNRKRNTCIYYIKAVIVRAGEPEPGVFGSLEPEPLEKKVRSRSLLKICRLPSPELKYSYAYACKSIVKTCTLTSEKNPRDLLLRNCRLSSSSINILFNQCHSVQTHIEI